MQQPALTDFRTRYGPWALVAGASAGLGAESVPLVIPVAYRPRR
jgi:hypothetical protein